MEWSLALRVAVNLVSGYPRLFLVALLSPSPHSRVGFSSGELFVGRIGP